ncbi:UNVERIFIED_ORG: hypothetical protein ABIB52_003241 [Arthrobacter sp. UYCu721]
MTTIIKRIKKALFSLRRPVRKDRPVRDDRREFNGQLLDRRREDVFVLLHQHMGGMN